MTTPVEDLDEHRIKAQLAQDLVDAGMPMVQATELAPILVHAVLKASRASNVVGWIAMLILLEDAKPTPTAGGMDAFFAWSNARSVAKRIIRDDLAHVLDARFVTMVEHALERRWPEMIAEIKTWKKEDE